ncbi:Retrovirus-related Pol polyprotein from transposon RE1 [Vitis vinifera]|uniref:Retrovirus-related Pol polyprotein from transposon RE1 n=1 Tax=Vitis vinifera TaxID=29760 RepID=A0A438BTI8_VITVI|nr:Retrovirus-related Pol polyprotein from transposon RE1 [Vitis vinifera]
MSNEQVCEALMADFEVKNNFSKVKLWVKMIRPAKEQEELYLLEACCGNSNRWFVSFIDACARVTWLYLDLPMTSSMPLHPLVQEALRDEKWRNTMSEDMRALEKNQTWEVVRLPKGKRLVRCKWVFIEKYKADGTLKRYKARLVAKGRGSLHGGSPLGFDGNFSGDSMCRPKKVLYGHKQSYRGWCERFAKVMPRMKDDLEEIKWLNKYHVAEIDIKDLGRLRYFLGIEVTHLNKGIFISQQKNVLDLLKETRMLGCKPANAPIEQNHRLVDDKDEATVD